MVTTRDISPEDFRSKRILANHKQRSLANALKCSRATIQNFESGTTQKLYSVNWEDLARELRIKPH